MESNETEFYSILRKKRLDIRYSYYFLLKKTVFFKKSVFFSADKFCRERAIGSCGGFQVAGGHRREEYRIPEIEPFCAQNTANPLFLFAGWHAWINERA
jgi:hypothetical protein